MEITNSAGVGKGVLLFLTVAWFYLQQPAHAQTKVQTASPDSTVTVVAGPHYTKSRLHQLFFGKHYRQVWAAPVQASVLNITSEMKGLEPFKSGGAYQTKNLRLRTKTGEEYVLRSVDKDPTQTYSAKTQKNFIGRILRDQTCVIHPYGYYILPVLSEAAGIYYTNPKLVFVPDDDRLGPYRADFANTLAMLEARPEGNRRDQANFGKSENIVSSRKAFERIYSDPCNKLDAPAYLRTRLFDVLIGDWSRREDQWRWATFPDGKSTVYRGIPRDRDHAFFKFDDGLITWLASKFNPNLRSFHHKIKNLEGLMLSAREMDSSFLVFLEEEDFVTSAESLKIAISDEVIEQAIKVWPQNIQEISGAEFTSKLKSRRGQLPTVARQYYRLLAREVSVPGTDKADRFVVKQLTNGNTELTLYTSETACAADSLLGSRVFKPSETNVISIYGLGGKDEILVESHSQNSIKLEVYGGEDKDQISVRKLYASGKRNKRITLFDPNDGDTISGSDFATVEKDHKPLAQEYNAHGWLLRHRLY